MHLHPDTNSTGNNSPPIRSKLGDQEDLQGIVPIYGEEAQLLNDGEASMLVGVGIYSLAMTWVNIQLVQFLYNYLFPN